MSERQVMDEKQLQEAVNEAAERFDVPGVAVGVYFQGEEHYGFAGVTSVENPLPVDDATLFQFGSTGKTYTATAIMRLVEEGKLDLDAPVRRYLPDLKLKDESVAEAVTILQLLNHTAGWSGDFMEDTGAGDDALEKYVAMLADIDQVTPLGAGASYNNASLSLAGHVIAVVTGETYEAAIQRLLLDPIGMDSTFFFQNEIMTRRFVVGHMKQEDGSFSVVRSWGMARSGAPAGGMSANAADQIKWARFHLGGGKGADGSQVLSEAAVRRMQEPTVEMRGAAIGDYVGISWLMRDIDGARVVGHGGTTVGQHSSFEMVPERDFAVISMTNAGTGPDFNDHIVKWALENYIDVAWRDPEPVTVGDAVLGQYEGTYATIATVMHITADNGQLKVKTDIQPAVREQFPELAAEADKQPPMVLGLLGEEGDQYVLVSESGRGMRGFFGRGDDGSINSLHIGGRLAMRV